MTTERETKIFCSNCGAMHEAHTSVNAELAPVPGSLSICESCAQVSVFKDDLTLRNITEVEMQELAINQPREFYQIQMATHYINQRIKQN